jgi:hypothetical protein
MVGIDKIRTFPPERANRLVGLGANGSRLRPYDCMLAVRLVPDRRNINALPLPFNDRLQQRLSLTGEPVANPE